MSPDPYIHFVDWFMRKEGYVLREAYERKSNLLFVYCYRRKPNEWLVFSTYHPYLEYSTASKQNFIDNYRTMTPITSKAKDYYVDQYTK